MPAQPVEEDSGEHISVQRTMTPADRKLREAIDEIRTSGDPAVIAGFEAIAKAAREQRKAYEREIADERAELAAATERLARIEASHSRWRTPVQLLKGLGFGGVVAALAFCARALIAHGDAMAEARRQTALVQRHEEVLRRLAEDLAKDRAQAAADHALITLLVARLGATP